MNQILLDGADRAQWCEDASARGETGFEDPPYAVRRGYGGHREPSPASLPALPAAALEGEPRGDEVAETSALKSSMTVILGAGMIAELVLPWALIGLSDLFLFDTPAWSVWAVFVTPPMITLVAVLTRLAIRRRAGHRRSVSKPSVDSWTAR